MRQHTRIMYINLQVKPYRLKEYASYKYLQTILIYFSTILVYKFVDNLQITVLTYLVVIIFSGLIKI
jgi:hypothetical protein